MVIQRVQPLVPSAVRERPDAARTVGVTVSLSEMQEYLEARRVPEEVINRQLLTLDRVALQGREQPQPQFDMLSAEQDICRMRDDLRMVDDVRTRRKAALVEEDRRQEDSSTQHQRRATRRTGITQSWILPQYLGSQTPPEAAPFCVYAGTSSSSVAWEKDF